MVDRVSDLIDHFGINSIEQATKEGFSGIPNYFENHDSDHEANNGIGLRIAKPYADDSHKYA